MNSKHIKVILFALFTVFFIIDLYTPLGIADGMLYIAAIPLLLFFSDSRFIGIATILALLLIVLGYFLSPASPSIANTNIVITNRIFSLLGVLFCAFMILKINSKQNQIIKLNNSLEEKVKSRTLKLTELLAKEKELNEMKSNFISMASHEFRTPLAAIISSASIIDMYKAAEKDEKIIKHVNRIYSNVNNLTEILNNFLSIGEIEGGNLTVKYLPINLPEFIEEVIQELDVITNKKNQTITYSHEGEEIINNSDKILRNILVNLISNASKYSHENQEIRITSVVDSDLVKLTVMDDGIGIPEADQNKLFTPFFRADNAKNIQGTGLGLNIVKKYVEMIEGQISFTSKTNEGTTFIIGFQK